MAPVIGYVGILCGILIDRRRLCYPRLYVDIRDHLFSQGVFTEHKSLRAVHGRGISDREISPDHIGDLFLYIQAAGYSSDTVQQHHAQHQRYYDKNAAPFISSQIGQGKTRDIRARRALSDGALSFAAFHISERLDRRNIRRRSHWFPSAEEHCQGC